MGFLIKFCGFFILFSGITENVNCFTTNHVSLSHINATLVNSSSNSNDSSSLIVFPEEKESSIIPTEPDDEETTTKQTVVVNPQEPSPGVKKLSQVLNQTIFQINILVKNISKKGQRDFERVGDILRSVQTFLEERGSAISHEMEKNLETEVKAIQTFLNDHQQDFAREFPSSIDNSTITNSNGTGERGGRIFPTSGITQNIMQISSKVGEGVRSTFEGVDNIVTNSINQIQNQIQYFLDGVTNFFSTKSGQPTNPQRVFDNNPNLQTNPLFFKRL